MLRAIILAACVFFSTTSAAYAQVVYRCSGADGKKYYGSTIPPQCARGPIDQLDGHANLVKRLDPDAEQKERIAQALAAANRKEDEAFARTEMRRNQALLATYTNEREIDDARARALKDNERARQQHEEKIAALTKRRAEYDKELQFYKNTSAPLRLVEDIAKCDAELKAHQDDLAEGKKQIDLINAKYDEAQKRYLDITTAPHK